MFNLNKSLIFVHASLNYNLKQNLAVKNAYNLWNGQNLSRQNSQSHNLWPTIFFTARNIKNYRLCNQN